MLMAMDITARLAAVRTAESRTMKMPTITAISMIANCFVGKGSGHGGGRSPTSISAVSSAGRVALTSAIRSLSSGMKLTDSAAIGSFQDNEQYALLVFT